MFSAQVSAFKSAITGPSYMQSDKQVIVKIIKEKLPALVTYIGDKQFCMGSSPKWLDFVIFEVLEQTAFLHPGVYEDHPTLKGLHDRIAALAGVKEYLADPNCVEKTYSFNNKHAKINNVDYSK